MYTHAPPTNPLGGNPGTGCRLQRQSTESSRPRRRSTSHLLRHMPSIGLDHPSKIQHTPRSNTPPTGKNHWRSNSNGSDSNSINVETSTLRLPSPNIDGPTISPHNQLRPTPVPQNHNAPSRLPTAQQQERSTRRNKWTQAEDEKIIELRGSGMKWEDISRNIDGRSSISCRLHYQNYLERRSEWDEKRRDQLARLYERFKADMWAKIAAELGVPWRAAEAMHWVIGEQEMADRAGVVPFSLAAVDSEANATGRGRNSLSRAQGSQQQFPLQLQPQMQWHTRLQPRQRRTRRQHQSVSHGTDASQPRSLYSQNSQDHPGSSGHRTSEPRAATRASVNSTMQDPSVPYPGSCTGTLSFPNPAITEQRNVPFPEIPTLTPIRSQAPPTWRHQLPSISQLTTGVLSCGSPVAEAQSRESSRLKGKTRGS